jgi:putative FmdB family regulatory protein
MPLYEYACRSCGDRMERMRKVEERLLGPDCPTCGQPAALAMSVPGRVGGGGSASASPSSWGEGCAPGGCCGGGACSPSFN